MNSIFLEGGGGTGPGHRLKYKNTPLIRSHTYAFDIFCFNSQTYGRFYRPLTQSALRGSKMGFPNKKVFMSKGQKTKGGGGSFPPPLPLPLPIGYGVKTIQYKVSVFSF